MAVVTAVISHEGGAMKVVWPNMKNGDTGSLVEIPYLPDKSVQLSGTLGTGGNARMQGTNDGGTSYGTLVDPQGNDLDLATIGKIETILDNPGGIRPSITAGDGSTDLTVTIYAVGGRS